MIRIEEINDINLSHVDKTAWDGLVLNSNHYSPFQTYEWISTYTKHYIPSTALLLLLAYDGDTLVGIAPFAKFEFRRLKLFKFRKLVFIGEIFSEYCDFIVHDKYADQVIPLFIDYVISTYSGIDRIDLRDIYFDSPTINILSKSEKYIINQFNGEKYLYIDTSKNKGEYYKQFGSKTLQTLERKAEKLKEINSVFLFQDEYDKRKIAELILFNRSRISQKGEISFFDLDNNEEFFKDIALQFNQNSLLFLNSCIINDEAASFYLGFLFHNKFYFFISGFSSKYVNLSVGTIHLKKIIDFCFDNQILEFDFMRGEDNYKYRFHPETRYTKRIIIIRKSRISIFRNYLFNIYQSFKKYL
jgi:CelD/BcsL family acetyltransferase involved in cellulose biosynthesis